MSSGADPDGARPLAGAPFLGQPPLQRVVAAIGRDGDVVRVVGGAVRNALLGLPIADIDLATTATPDRVLARAEAGGLKAVPTGVEHGTVTVVADGHPFEVTTLREDIDTDGRHAVVRFGRDWRRDAERRDFTVNALYADLDGTVQDFFGGLDDARARRIRFIGEARARIREDYLRILRFFRFHAAFGAGALDRDGLAACTAEREGLAKLSAERVRAEILKFLATPGAVATSRDMAEAGILPAVLGSVPRLGRLARLAAVEATLGRAADPLLRLAALALIVREDVTRLKARLRLANAEAERLARMATGGPVPSPALGDKETRSLLYRLGASAFEDRVLLAWADAGAPPDDPAWRDLLGLPGRWAPPVLPVTGHTLIARGMAPGPALGRVLAAVEAGWIAVDFSDDPAVLETIVGRAMDAARENAAPTAHKASGTAV